ncbi:retrovirus-related pol polyprotein from transposon TNT 1-94 [Tanacetum coccineum]
MNEFSQLDSGLAVPVFTQGDDPIACLNKAMAFLTTVASSRFPLTNNQLRTSSNPRNQATIQDGRVTVQQVQGRQGQSYVGTGYMGKATSSGGNNEGDQARVVKCYNCQGEGHMARQCTQPKRPRNAAWFKDKAMLAEAQESSQILDEEQLAFLVDLGILDIQATHTIIPNNVAFQTEDLDAYDSDCDDISTAQVVLMANLSNYGLDVILEEEMAPMASSDPEVKTCSKTCLKNYETLKKQCDDLIVKLNQTEFIVATYKRGLATVEDQLITYRKNDVLFSEEVAVLKREVAYKDYEINMLKKPEFKGYGPENSKQESNVVYDKESDNSKDNSDESYGRRTDMVKSNAVCCCCSRQVNTARPKAVVNAVRTNRVNVVKASACWVWRPVVKPNNASITLKRYTI